jgi:hypothetical protein
MRKHQRNREQEDANMGARRKLNQAYVCGSLIVAGLIGLATESWLVFIVVLGISLALNLYSGEIRAGKGGRR